MVNFQQSLWKMESALTDNHTQIDPFALIGEMADLLAQHKLVPFFGAGLSRQHLGVAAAELASEMATEIEIGGRPGVRIDAYMRGTPQSVVVWPADEPDTVLAVIGSGVADAKVEAALSAAAGP